MKSLFGQFFRGLSDSLFSGGSVYRSVGLDFRSEPGKIKAHQRMKKDSGETIDELCKVSIQLSDDSRLHFSSESGKIWRDVNGVYSLFYTQEPIDAYDVFTINNETLNRSVKENTQDPIIFAGNQFNITGLPRLMIFERFGGTVYRYNNNTSFGFRITDFEYEGQSADFSSQTNDCQAAFVRQDGTKGYVCSETHIFEYNFSTAWHANTMSYTSNSYEPTEVNGVIAGISFSNDGTKMFVYDTDGELFQYTLSTPWNVSTATYDSVSFDGFDGTGASTLSIAISPDGKKLYACRFRDVGTPGGIVQYEFGTPWDASTLSSNEHSFVPQPPGRTEFIQNICFTPEINNTVKMLASGIRTLNLDDDTGGFTSQGGWIFQYGISNEDHTDNIILGAEEHEMYIQDTSFRYSKIDFERYLYFWTKDIIFRVPIKNLNDLGYHIQSAGTFKNGNENHPSVKNNNQLYIADGSIISQVANDGTFIKETFFNLANTETIQALTSFDTDVLVGTKDIGFGRILRWDGFSESWSAEDDVFEKEGVRAFIKDDNLVYASVGTRGNIYFYNGAKLEDFLNIPEVLNNDKVKINPNATEFFLNTPIFGLSNESGNPVLQGIYGFGSYSSRYPKALTLDYKIGDFSNLEIGVLLKDGTDLYATYKTDSDVGVMKIDWDNKYEEAYLETKALSNFQNRHQLKTITEAIAPYFSLPEETSITIGHKKTYENNFTDYEMKVDTKRKIVRAETPSVPDVANPQLRLKLTVNGNNSPEFEDLLYEIGPITKR